MAQTSSTTTSDPWADREFVKREWRKDRGFAQLQCKFPEDGRRCNAKLDSLLKMTRHLREIHGYRYLGYKRERRK